MLSDEQSRNRLWPESLIAYDLTVDSPELNLALDEALLAAVESDPEAASLRIWEPDSSFVVLGRSNRVETEVNASVCDTEGVPILRRASGGGTVLIGPGCLCYSLALPLNETHRALGISRVTSMLMQRTAEGLQAILPGVSVRGTSDLVWNNRKFSGNAQRWLRKSFVHHGTLLYEFDLSRLGRCLGLPSRQPDYRQSRGHLEFVTNVPISRDRLRSCLASTWNSIPGVFPDQVLVDARKIVEVRSGSTDWVL
jgi:lipoate-protein ligase A